jgi:aryl-alcohol dehydrogenase-like predicted oxidoreductase
VEAFGRTAERKVCKCSQLTPVWLLAHGEDIFVLPGTTQIKYLEENVGTLDVKLTDEEVKEIRKVVDEAEVHGARYPEGVHGDV